MALTKVSGHILDTNLDLGTIEVSTVQVGSATTIHTTGIDLGSGNITSHNINSTGIITASSFSGNVTGNVTGNADTASNLTGSPNITVTDITANGNVSIAGTLTYEDVTNIDSVGLITARSGIDSKDYSLSAISSSISDTAVDVFVYDTSKDSDGGAWRKRTQHTSWYNETLGTATRGTRREFPAVAVIVVTAATTRKLYIYDGDDPDLPMWMVIDSIDSNWPLTEFSSLYALNGIIALGSSSNIQPLYETRNRLDLYYFVSDKIESSGYGTSGTYYGTVEGLVNRRNHARHIDLRASTTGNSVYDLVDRRVNDVAMTVLPNAPIDDATGLPTPTIAVATDGGVSVIKDDGSVVDINRTSDDDVHHVDLDGDRVIMFMELGAIYVATIPSEDQSGNPNSAWTVYGSYGGNTSGTDHPAVQAYGAGVDLVSMKNHTFATAGFNDSNDLYKGLSILSENLESSGNGMVAWAHTDFNTGWMQGDIKGAFLSDTDATNIANHSSGNLINYNGNDAGDFNSADDLNAWTGSGLSHDAANSRLVVDKSINGSFSVDGILTIGKRYELSWDVASQSPSYGKVMLNSTTAGSVVELEAGAGTGSYEFTAADTDLDLYLFNGGSSHVANINSITIVPVVDDRSVNNNGLQVFGTVTKSAVATGAELVAYSGFTDNDYLTQPFNSDLEFGTGDYYMSIWAKGGGDAQCLMIREHGTADDDGAILLFQHSGKYAFYSRQNGTANWTNFLASDATYGDFWSHLVMVRTGGTLYGYVNGKLEGSSSFAGDVSNNDAKLFFGRRNPSVDNTQEYSGSLALAKIGGSAPSAEQVKKMYEDEKMLFQENAKCTLYGSSDAVTALAYDEDTEFLHVGTSSGRSDFQGLRRINNTTTAVTTAISASDELIAEQ